MFERAAGEREREKLGADILYMFVIRQREGGFNSRIQVTFCFLLALLSE